MTYAIARFLRIVVPALSMLLIVIVTWGHFWHVVIGLAVVLGQGWFMEAFGAYERDVEEYQKRSVKK